jgi:uncharacterized protein
VRQRVARIVVFYVPTFLLTHAIVAVYLASGGSFRHLASFGFGNLAMLVPGLVAAGVARWVYREPVRKVLRLSFRPNRWFAFAWLAAPVLSLVILAIGLLVSRGGWAPSLPGLTERFDLSPAELELALRPLGPLAPPWTFLVQGLVLGPTLSAISGLGEEAGWRGLLHHELRSLGFWRESALVGLLWGLWHLPLVFQGYGYPHHPWLGSLLLLAFTLASAPLYTLVAERSGSSVAAAILHGGFSASMLLTITPIAGGGELVTGLTGLAGVAVLALVDLAILVGRWRRSPNSETGPVAVRGT